MEELIYKYVPILSPLIVAIATVALAYLTFKYVSLTKYMVDEMKLAKEPAINIDLELPGGGLRFIVKNDGQSVAKNIHFDVKKDIDWVRSGVDGGGVRNIDPVRKGISYMAPGRTLKYYGRGAGSWGWGRTVPSILITGRYGKKRHHIWLRRLFSGVK